MVGARHPTLLTGGDGFGLCAVHADHAAPTCFRMPAWTAQCWRSRGFYRGGCAWAGASSDLTISVETLMDINGAPIPAATVSNTLVIDPGSGPGVAVLSIAPGKQRLYGNARPPHTCS